MSDFVFQKRIISGAFDRAGNQISAYDVVKIIELPSYLENDIHNGEHIYRKYINCIGMIIYQDGYDLENVIWFDGQKILLDVIFERNNAFERAEIAIPAICVKKMKLSSELYSIFFRYSTIIDDNSEDEALFFNYNYIRKVISSAEECYTPI